MQRETIRREAQALVNVQLIRTYSFFVATAVLLLSGCAADKTKAAGPPPAVPVTVATVEQKTVPVMLQGIGNAQPYSTVGIRSQVAGQILTVNFKEGDDVKKGELLFTIDPRPFEAALAQAQSNLARDKAQAKNARVQAERYTALVKEGVVAKEQYDQIVANADALDAAVLADEAAVQTAQVNLSYTKIYSPISGRTGYLMVHGGNLVKANDAPDLVVINQVEPIYVDVAYPEDTLPQLQKYATASKLQMTAVPSKTNEKPSVGVLSVIDNKVDQATGTYHVKGMFANTDRRLWPGQFLDVSITLTSRPNAVLVPSQAVQTGQNGQYVFIVKQDNNVEMRTVATGTSIGNDVIIENGVQPGERVVTDGQMRLVPGKTRVDIKNSNTSNASTSLPVAGD